MFFSLILLIFENIAHYEKRNLEIHSADYRINSHGDSDNAGCDELYVRRPLPPPSPVGREPMRGKPFIQGQNISLSRKQSWEALSFILT